MFLANFLRAISAFRRYRAAVRQLSNLDDRALRDIGLNRSMIRHAARFGVDR